MGSGEWPLFMGSGEVMAMGSGEGHGTKAAAAAAAAVVSKALAAGG